jgi:uncharacterized protein
MARSLHLLLALLAPGLGACSGSQTVEPVAASEPAPPSVEVVKEPAPPVATPAVPVAAVAAEQPTYALGDHYTKTEHQIPMRDGARLFTQVYAPKDTSTTYPIMMIRTPYSVGPYGADRFPDVSGSFESFARDGFIIVKQDVRGRYMSEGEFENMRPHNPRKVGTTEIDESSDTYDTIDWLIKNVPNHNGRAGMWGISYPGFYASAGMIDAHPALRAVSPQAPIGDWFFDDFYHHGAFFLPHFFNFFSGFGKERPAPTTEGSRGFQHSTPDGYQFFLDMGSLKTIEEKYYKGQIAFWKDVVAHPSYDKFWQDRRILTHLKRVAPAVMTVGGWYDAEDLYGALNTYRAVEQQNPGVFNVLVMGPWAHGGWSRGNGESLGNISFGSATSPYYQENIELAFFRRFLKDDVSEHTEVAEASVFETGENRWRRFDQWPPARVTPRELYLHAGGRLSFEKPEGGDGADEFISDPAKPAPYSETFSTGMTREYMTDDQRFASRRPDVLAYQTEPLTEDLTLAGPVLAHLAVSITGTDADWVVKLIDVFPPDAPEPGAPAQTTGRGRPRREPGWKPMSGYQMMVRSEAFRGRYRTGYDKPTPFIPGKVEVVEVPLQDVLHTFKKGHRLMIQVQSTWFPLMDRNPQKYVDNIFLAQDSDFIKATHRVHRSASAPTFVRIPVLPPETGR